MNDEKASKAFSNETMHDKIVYNQKKPAKSPTREIRERWKLAAYCFGLAISFLLLGFDGSVVSAVSAMPQFQ
jgi:hypothetical protein